MRMILQEVEKLRDRTGPPSKGYFYSGTADLVLHHGQLFSPVDQPKGLKKGRYKLCFKNAFEAADRGFGEYAEGFATTAANPFPVHHAWIVRSEGHVIDPTWNDGEDYFGIVFPLKVVSAIICAKRFYGVLEDWDNQNPILRQRLDFVTLVKIYQNLM